MILLPTPMRCKCGHQWQGQLLVDCSAPLAALALRETRCPDCGGRFKGIVIDLGAASDEAKAKVDA